MPFADYKDFADCVRKNKSKRSPDAYCGYIKNQVEGGKKKEEYMESPTHEAYHLEEEIRKMEGGVICPKCGGRNTSTYASDPNLATCRDCDGYVFNVSTDFDKQAMAFLDTLSAAIDEVTLLAKDEGYYGQVSEKVSPTEPPYQFNVVKSDKMADVVVKQAKGFEVHVNYFNTVLDELRDIVKSANKYFIESGWNSKETIKEYEAHKKKWGTGDWM